MKKTLRSICIAAVISALFCPLYANANGSVADPDTNSEIRVEIDGQKVDFDVPPQIINSRTMVPMRAIFEALGMELNWSSTTKVATAWGQSAQGENVTVMIEPGCGYMLRNGQTVELDSPPVLISGRNLVPVRAIAEAAGCEVEWQQSTRTVIITNDENASDAAASSAAAVMTDDQLADYADSMIMDQYNFLYGLSWGAVLEQNFAASVKVGYDYWSPLKDARYMLDIQQEWNKYFSYQVPVPDELLSHYRMINGRLYTDNSGIGDDICQGPISITGVSYRVSDYAELTGISMRYDDPTASADEGEIGTFTYRMVLENGFWACSYIESETGNAWSVN